MIAASLREDGTAKDRFDAVPERDSTVIRQNSRSFSLASRLLPDEVREDVQKLYAWCRWSDDAVDSANSTEEAAARLAVLRDDVERIYRGQSARHRASRWLAELVSKYPIERQLPLGLLDGMEMDLRLGQIQTHNELLRYCYLAAGVVGVMMCRVFGVTDPRAVQHATSLGIAMQLTNIARDVREDRERDRCYLPKSWLQPASGAPAPSDDQHRESVRRVLDLAEEYYQIGNGGIHYLPHSVRPAIRIASAVYREIGQQIRRRDYRVMDGRTVVPKVRFLRAMLAAWSRGFVQDFRASPPRFNPIEPSFPRIATECMMNDAKYLTYLGLSLTAFMGSGLFLLVLLNPKLPTYSVLPMIYASVCFAVGIATNLLAKRAESSPPARRSVEDSGNAS